MLSLHLSDWRSQEASRIIKRSFAFLTTTFHQIVMQGESKTENVPLPFALQDTTKRLSPSSVQR